VALALGLLLSNVVGLPRWLDAGFRVEFYIKTGIVLLGATLPLTLLAWGGPAAIRRKPGPLTPGEVGVRDSAGAGRRLSSRRAELNAGRGVPSETALIPPRRQVELKRIEAA